MDKSSQKEEPSSISFDDISAELDKAVIEGKEAGRVGFGSDFVHQTSGGLGQYVGDIVSSQDELSRGRNK